MEGFRAGWWAEVGQAQCKTQAEEQEDHPEDHPGHPGHKEDWEMGVVKSRTELLIFERVVCEVHLPETNEQQLEDSGSGAPDSLETSLPSEA
jgi:hypothetical protein